MIVRLLAVAALVSPVATTAQAATPATTVQQDFDKASALYAAGDWDAALTAMDALQHRVKAGGRTFNVLELRRGIALTRLDRLPEAAQALGSSLKLLPMDDASLRIDRYEGYLSLASIATANFDPAAVVEAYAGAEAAAPDPAAGIEAIARRARINAYLDPSAAVAAIDRALVAYASLPSPNKGLEGQMRTIRGRALLNAGKFAAARVELLKAVDLLGGLTMKVSMSDVSARSDLSIAALLAGDQAAAKKYLAYSGAGTMDNFFRKGAAMEPPVCGSSTGLAPSDVAVVEFGITDSGTVSYAAPVYVSRPGPTAIEFARAVAKWSWEPDALAKIPGFFRQMTRIELRCSAASERPTLQTYFDAATRQWFEDRHLPKVTLSTIEATDLATLRKQIAERRQAPGTTPLDLAPLLFELAHNAAASKSDRFSASKDWGNAVVAAGPPPMVRAAALWDPVASEASLFLFANPNARTAKIRSPDRLLSDREIAGDPRASAALRLSIADYALNARDYSAAKPLIRNVIDDRRLGEGDPLRVAALIRSSAIALADGDLVAARTAFEQSGLSDAQCALIDASPAVVHRSATSEDYPREAMAWGISGWAVTEFDIAADGKTRNVRAVAAYPPFVFDSPTVKIYQTATYTHSYRPQSDLGCGGFRATINFKTHS